MRLSNAPTRQDGLVLIMGLVFMIILTIIGISSLRSSQLTNIIISNNQTQMLALNRTEVMLKDGERDIDTITSDGSTKDFEQTGDHYYLNGTTNPLSDSWLFTAQGNSSSGQYVIEYSGKKMLPGASSAWGAGVAGDSVYLFTIDAKHQLGNGARRLTESLYVTQTPP